MPIVMVSFWLIAVQGLVLYDLLLATPSIFRGVLHFEHFGLLPVSTQ